MCVTGCCFLLKLPVCRPLALSATTKIKVGIMLLPNTAKSVSVIFHPFLCEHCLRQLPSLWNTLNSPDSSTEPKTTTWHLQRFEIDAYWECSLVSEVHTYIYSALMSCSYVFLCFFTFKNPTNVICNESAEGVCEVTRLLSTGVEQSFCLLPTPPSQSSKEALSDLHPAMYSVHTHTHYFYPSFIFVLWTTVWNPVDLVLDTGQKKDLA